MELIERRSTDLPVMLLVQVSQSHGVGEELVEILDTGPAHGGVKGDGQPGYGPVVLKLLGLLNGHGTGPLDDDGVFVLFGHDLSSVSRWCRTGHVCDGVAGRRV